MERIRLRDMEASKASSSRFVTPMSRDSSLAQSIDSLPQLSLSNSGGATFGTSYSGSRQQLVETPDSESTKRRNHPWAATGGVPPGPKRASPRRDRKRKRHYMLDGSTDLGEQADASDLEGPATSVWSSRSSVQPPRAPQLDQRSRFGSLPLTSPMDPYPPAASQSQPLLSAFMDAAIIQNEGGDAGERMGAASEWSSDLMMQLGGEDSESKSRAWLAQCNAALQRQGSDQGAEPGSYPWASLLSPWTPSSMTPAISQGGDDTSSLSGFPMASRASTPPTSSEQMQDVSTTLSPASCTRSKARKAAAQQHLKEQHTYGALPNFTSMQSQVKAAAMGDAASVASSNSNAVAARKPPIPWKLRARSEVRRTAGAAAGETTPTGTAGLRTPRGTGAPLAPPLFRTRSSSSLSSTPYTPSPLGLGIRSPKGKHATATAAAPPSTDHASSLKRSRTTAMDRGADGNDGAAAAAGSVAKSRRNSESAMSTSSASSNSRVGTPFSAGSCGAALPATNDYFGNAWQASRRVC